MITPIELAVLAFAGYRATQLIVHDSILDRPRDLVHAWHQRRPTSSLRTGIVTLISCVYCSGWWISGLLLALYLTVADLWPAAPIAVHLIEWATVAGAAVLLNRLDDTMGSLQRAADQ
ncbi:DUF1360 domain-containing protein [Nonomuraea sp. NPDC049646]|uniref:DUF1360 domain-containing protein n=1 Tax=unclassified Nonomuraea TaxID=2593643 RepID=UPI0037B6183A